MTIRVADIIASTHGSKQIRTIPDPDTFNSSFESHFKIYVKIKNTYIGCFCHRLQNFLTRDINQSKLVQLVSETRNGTTFLFILNLIYILRVLL